ncbi:hypothetical protein SAMN03003324_00909 [Pedobacter antarcticus]|uniref:Uncharacterized protein n=1 Tax=Pedobacter antarcticus TaxID=34086 RepID=A0A1I2BJS5_9SPHI|nr:hypothetical protein [Pedobacter antarcticus]SFE56442.1 hypothetical protein SAMN03003324_00909 [Pedobacter antarcticus]
MKMINILNKQYKSGFFSLLSGKTGISIFVAILKYPNYSIAHPLKFVFSSRVTFEVPTPPLWLNLLY